MVFPSITVTMKEDGKVGISTHGPRNLMLYLGMLDEAKTILTVKVATNELFARFAQASEAQARTALEAARIDRAIKGR